MTMKRYAYAFAAAAMSIAFAASGNAATILFTYTGTVASGYDYTGEFGVANTSLNGMAFTAIYTLAYPSSRAGETDDGTLHNIRVGSLFGLGIPSPLSASLTINGVTHSFRADRDGGAEISDRLYKPDRNADGINNFAEKYEYDGNGYITSMQIRNSVGSNFNQIVNSNLFTQDIQYFITNNDISFGDFQFLSYISDSLTGNNAFISNAHGSLTNETVSITAVPEPASWAMLLAGFGMVGGAMRRRAMRLSFAR